MKVQRIVFLTVLTFFLTACDVDLYRSLPEDEANQMLALLMQHHIDAEKNRKRTVLPYVSSSRSLLTRLSYLDLTVIRIGSLQRRIRCFRLIS